MNVRKQSKLKSAGRIRHYKRFGWLGPIAYRLRGDNTIRHYLKTGKYIQTRGETYELIPGFGMYVQDLLISSTVKRSRVKNMPDGCVVVHIDEEEE